MIGRRWKPREGWSRAVLIGRALPSRPSGSSSLPVTLCGPEGTAARLARKQQNAPWRPAAMAGEAHPVPSRTRKLSPRAPMVLRSKSVGEQDAAGHQGAFCQGRPPPRERRGPPRVSRRPACRAGGGRGRVRPRPLSGMGDRAPASAPEACEQGRDDALGEGRNAVRGAADGGVHAPPAQGRVPVDLRLRVGDNHVVKLQALGNA